MLNSQIVIVAAVVVFSSAHENSRKENTTCKYEKR